MKFGNIKKGRFSSVKFILLSCFLGKGNGFKSNSHLLKKEGLRLEVNYLDKKFTEKRLWNDEEYPENLVKGRLAEAIVSGMLKEAGFQVYRFGYEGLLENLAQMNRSLEKNITAEKIRSMPDFVVISSEGCAEFVEVKFRKELSRWSNKLIVGKASKYWEEARLILVTLEEPFFRTALIKDVNNGKEFQPLGEDHSLRIGEEIIKKHGKYVSTYLCVDVRTLDNFSKEYQKYERAKKLSNEELDTQLLNELKNLRDKIGKEKRLEPYLVFPYDTLKEMVQYKPVTLGMFLEIKGIGEKKAEMYGEEFIGVIRKFCE